MKNESLLVKSTKNRTLTAKGVKYKNKVITILANHFGVTRYHKEFKDKKDKTSKLLDHLIIDKKMSIEQINDILKRSKNKQISI